MDKVVASMKDGVLTIDAPKDPVKVQELVRRIEVEDHDKKMEMKEEEPTPIKVEKIEAKKVETEKVAP